MEFTFAGPVIEWRGPAPYYYLPVPDHESADIREMTGMASYGWGVIPVVARIGEVEFDTSLFPKDGRYLLPLKDAVRKPQQITVGDEITVEMTVRLQGGLDGSVHDLDTRDQRADHDAKELGKRRDA